MDSTNPGETTPVQPVATTAPESAAMILTKTWMRADGTTRQNFLRDIRAGMPNLWRAVEGEFTEGAKPHKHKRPC